MPQIVELPDDLADTLNLEASRLGLSLHEYTLHLLTSVHFPAVSTLKGVDLVAFWQAEGLVGNHPEISDNQTESRKLGDQAQRRGQWE